MNNLKFLDDPNMQAPPQRFGIAIASLILGIISIAMSIFITGFVFGLVGLVLGIIGLSSSNKSMSGWGLGLSLSGMLLSCMFGLVYYAGYKKTAISKDSIESTFVPTSSLIGKPSPDLTITELNDVTYKLSSLKGTQVWLNIWSPYSLQDRDTAAKLAKIASDGNSGPQIIGISYLTDANELAGLKQQLNIPYTLAISNDYENYISNYDSCTVLIDPNGIVYDLIDGYHNPQILKQKAMGLDFTPADPNKFKDKDEEEWD